MQDLRDRAGGIVLSLTRLVVGFLFLLHGAATLFGVLGGAMGRQGAAPVGAWPSWWAGLIQFVGGGLVLLGLLTMPAALVCAGAMAYAYFSVHQPRGLFPLQNGGVAAALYCWFFVLIAALGPGPYALDAVLPKLRKSARAQARAARSWRMHPSH